MHPNPDTSNFAGRGRRARVRSLRRDHLSSERVDSPSAGKNFVGAWVLAQ